MEGLCTSFVYQLLTGVKWLLWRGILAVGMRFIGRYRCGEVAGVERLSPGQTIATFEQRGQTRTTCCAQQCCDMLRSNVAIGLAGACKCWADNVGICCAEMLRSFGRGFTTYTQSFENFSPGDFYTISLQFESSVILD